MKKRSKELPVADTANSGYGVSNLNNVGSSYLDSSNVNGKRAYSPRQSPSYYNRNASALYPNNNSSGTQAAPGRVFGVENNNKSYANRANNLTNNSRYMSPTSNAYKSAYKNYDYGSVTNSPSAYTRGQENQYSSPSGYNRLNNLSNLNQSKFNGGSNYGEYQPNSYGGNNYGCDNTTGNSNNMRYCR